MSWVITGSEKTPVDPFRSDVLVLLHGYGANNSTTITDNSPSPKTATAVNGAKIVTGVADPFGNSTRGVMSFTASTSSRVELPKGTVWNLPGNFTIEFWAQQGAISGGLDSMFEFGSISSAGDLGLLYRAGDAKIFMATTQEPMSGTFNFTLNLWLHWACVRNGSTVTIYRDGVSVTSKTRTGTLTNVNGAQAGGIYLGDSIHAPGRAWNGYISDLRITKDVARYTANFTPPTAPFPDI
jgi:hypothetical protein